MKYQGYLKMATFLIAASLSLAAHAADGQRPRTGKQVVDEVCAKCHATGAQGAPRIGDNKAWQTRASRGLSSLNQSALKGIRNMPPHGARMDLTDLELKRAVTYMVNQSGGNWIEPADTQHPRVRSGREVVEARCSKCHATGEGGAPRIGDRAAWIPRLRNGFEGTVRSAINGHGGMPARGGLPDLTDHEIRGAIVYMFNPDPPAQK
ncbi:MAG TPA: c-type cytochrome [Burkholderiales bacterium]|nr:c-type cytochrome [Burkholderiales bacterium]